MMELVEDVFDHYMDVSCVEFYPSTASECDGIDAMDVKLISHNEEKLKKLLVHF